MQFFPYGNDVPISIVVSGLPIKLSDYALIECTITSEDLKVRGSRTSKTIEPTIDSEGGEEGSYSGALSLTFPSSSQVSDMVYHVTVTFKTEDTTNNVVFRNAFCVFNSLSDIPPRLMVLDTTRQTDYCNLVSQLIVGNGKSAYDLAVQEGFTGTLTQWLASLTQPIYGQYQAQCEARSATPLSESAFWTKFINIINS